MPQPQLPSNNARIGELVFAAQEKINSEVAALMYGSLVTEILKDLEDIDSANAELERLGVDTGARIVEEFLAKTQLPSCNNFHETCEVIAKIGFKMFLGVAADVTSVEEKGAVCKISLPYNPLAEFVELPVSLETFNYHSFLSGVIKGALEQVEVTLLQDTLKGAATNEFRLELIELLKDAFIDTEGN